MSVGYPSYEHQKCIDGALARMDIVQNNAQIWDLLIGAGVRFRACLLFKPQLQLL